MNPHPAGTTTIRLAAALQAQHAAGRDRSLTVLRGGLSAEAGLLGLLEQLREANTRRLNNAEVDTDSAPSDRQMLETWLQVVRRLHGREGRRRATRLLRKEADAGADLRQLGARFARHCGQQCSLTGVRISGLQVQMPGPGSSVTCNAVPASRLALDPPVPGATLAGAFAMPASAVGGGRQLGIDVHNVLGHTRPLVPIFVQAVATLLDGRSLPMGGEIFVFAEEVVAGTRRRLTCAADGLLDVLPCPAGLIQSLRVYMWLPTTTGVAPGPVDQRQVLRVA